MFFRGHLRTHLHAVGFFYLPEPLEALRAHTLKGARVRARLPDAGAEYVNAEGIEPFGGFHYLLFGLRTAGTGDTHGTRQGEKAPLGSGNDIKFVCHILSF